VQISSSAAYSWLPSSYAPPSMWEIKVHNHTTQQAKLKFRMMLRHAYIFNSVCPTSICYGLCSIIHKQNIHYLLIFLHYFSFWFPKIRHIPENQEMEEHIWLTSYNFSSTCLELIYCLNDFAHLVMKLRVQFTSALEYPFKQNYTADILFIRSQGFFSPQFIFKSNVQVAD